MGKLRFFGISILLILINVFILLAQPPQGARQGGKISGEVIDNATGRPLSRANISVLNSTDSSIVTGIVAGNNGKFEIESIRQGSYVVRINFVGYAPFHSEVITINRDQRQHDLGKIRLAQGASLTDAIEVVSDRQMVEYSQGKRVFNVDQSIAASGGMAIDILKNIPSVDVDIDGNISLRGTSNLRVLVNGKPTSMDATTLMEQLPAASVESFEIITNPSARYDAEGMGGIINVVLKQNRDDGLNGLASVNFGTLDKYSFAINTTYQINKWNLFANYDFGSRRMRANGSSYRDTKFEETETSMEQDIRRRRNFMNHSVRTGFEYQMTPLDLLSMSFSFRASESSRYGNFTNTSFLPAENDSILGQYRRLSLEENRGPNFDYSLNYRRNFGSRGHDLTFDFFISQRDREEDTDYEQFDLLPIISNDFLENSYRDDLTRNINIQSDYLHPLGDYKFEVGGKFSIQTLDGDYSHFNIISDNPIDDPNKSNHFIYDENILAAYSIFSGEINKFSFQLGLRAEQTMLNTELKTTGETNDRDYLDFFPSIGLSYKFTDKDELMLNYSRRINRPRTRFLNPFVDYSDPNNLRSGNPNINPEYINAYEIAYMKNFKLFSVMPTLFYRKTDDKISFITDIIEPGVFKTTFENLAEGTNYGVELNVTLDFFKWMRFSTDYSYYRSEIKGAKESLELENNDYSWSLRGNANFFVTRDLSLQLIGNYRGPTVTAQGQRYEFYYVDLGARYDLWDRQATITFRISDVFDQMSFGGTATSNNFDTRYRMERESRVAYLGFQYKINEGPKQRERRRQQQQENGVDFDEF